MHKRLTCNCRSQYYRNNIIPSMGTHITPDIIVSIENWHSCVARSRSWRQEAVHACVCVCGVREHGVGSPCQAPLKLHKVERTFQPRDAVTSRLKPGLQGKSHTVPVLYAVLVQFGAVLRGTAGAAQSFATGGDSVPTSLRIYSQWSAGLFLARSDEANHTFKDIHKLTRTIARNTVIIF